MKKLSIIILILCCSLNKGEAQCTIPSTLELTYSYTVLTAGTTVLVTWNADCPNALMRIFLTSNFQAQQQFPNIPNSGTYLFQINSTHAAGTYRFYIEDMGRTIWDWGSEFQLLAAVLPVELTNFNGSAKNDEINLRWQTASETNNSGFEIQKSKNGIDWKAIGFIEGHGTTFEQQEYQYNDTNPFSGINYYRLKQIDYDGIFEYSKVVTVENNHSEKTIQVFPNPSNGLIDLRIDNPSSQKIKVNITDNLGRNIWESELIKSEPNFNKEINIEGNGIYFVTVQIGRETYYERVLITD